MRSVHIVVYGKPVRKSNRRQMVMRGGKPMLIKSKAALQYYKDFDLQIKQSDRVGFIGPVAISGTIYYSPTQIRAGKTIRANIKSASDSITHSWVGDLSVEALMDCIQHAGIIADDRQVVSINVQKGISFDSPRADIIIQEVESTTIPFEE